jgi:hypothetical protein
MEGDAKIFNFDDDYCRQLFPEYEPSRVHGILQKSSVSLLSLINSLYNGYRIPRTGKDEKMKTLKNLVAEHLIIPIFSELYPYDFKKLDDFNDYLFTNPILLRVIEGYNQNILTPYNINCLFFEFKEYQLQRIFRKLGIKGRMKFKIITEKINQIISDNCLGLYFLMKHYFRNKVFTVDIIGTVDYNEFKQYFRDVLWKKIYKVFDGTSIDKYKKDVSEYLIMRIIKIYNQEIVKCENKEVNLYFRNLL